MRGTDKELLRLIRKIRDRLHGAIIINYIATGINIALIVGLLTVLLSRFIPIYNVYGKTAISIVTIGFGAFLAGSFMTPDTKRAALKADSLGLKERCITALELIGQESSFALMQKSDALLHLKKLQYKRSITLAPKRKYLIICAVLTLVLAISGFVPNPMTQRAEELHSAKEKAQNQVKQIEKVQKEIKNDTKLTEEQKKELLNTLNKLKSELKEAKSEKEAERALKRAEKKLLEMNIQNKEQELSKLADTLAKNEATKKLSKIIKNGDTAALKEELKKLAETLKNMNEEELKQMAQDLKKLSEELANNKELKEALSELAQKLADGELGDISDEMSKLDSGISKLMQNQSFKEAVEKIQKEMNSIKGNGEQQSNLQQQNQSTNGQGQQDNGQIGQGGSQGANQGAWGNGIQGSQNQSGQGSGAGVGTDKGSENTTPTQPQTTGINKKDSSEKKVGEYEKIFTPKTLGGEGEQSNLKGQKGEGGNTGQITTDKANTIKGESVPYNQVMGQYKEKALTTIDSSDIPPGMKDIVKEYFSSLEE